MARRNHRTRPLRRRPGCPPRTPSGRKARFTARPLVVDTARLRAWTSQPFAAQRSPDVPSDSHPPDPMNDAALGRLAAAHADFTSLREILSDVRAACAALPQGEQERYREARQSVVDARRSAETHEGPLQVC
jgi:hypothetical protein